MGQTLTHGIYLPDEGERNCYNGLAANWQLLDGAVGTVAEHTAALAGKAPLVHTHTKADITDFPAYGTTAGTICEGNDSRLSDARTPVAHTHTKSDVTDLLNSNFIPSANNSYDLGSSSYQWNNLYAKNYYYNGTAWGLDKSNVWTGTNTFQQNITYEKANFFHKAVNPNYYLKDSELQVGVTPNSPHIACPGNWQDKNDQQLGYVRFVQYENSIQTFECDIRNKVSNGAWSPNGTLQTVGFQIVNNPTVSKGDFRLYANLVPNSDNNYDLGTATKRWKTLNGVNPGALSLPNLDSAVSLTTILQAAIDKTQTTNNWTANFTGILCINWITKNLTGPFRCSVYNASDIKNATWGQTFWADNVWYFIVSFPVQNGKTYYFDNTFTRTSEDSAHIVHSANAIYTLGNV